MPPSAPKSQECEGKMGAAWKQQVTRHGEEPRAAGGPLCGRDGAYDVSVYELPAPPAAPALRAGRMRTVAEGLWRRGRRRQRVEWASPPPRPAGAGVPLLAADRSAAGDLISGGRSDQRRAHGGSGGGDACGGGAWNARRGAERRWHAGDGAGAGDAPRRRRACSASAYRPFLPASLGSSPASPARLRRALAPATGDGGGGDGPRHVWSTTPYIPRPMSAKAPNALTRSVNGNGKRGAARAARCGAAPAAAPPSAGRQKAEAPAGPGRI
eukprot:gene6705-1311_t